MGVAPDVDEVAAQLGLDADDPVVAAVRDAIAKRRSEQAAPTPGPASQPPTGERFADFDAHFAEQDDDRTPVTIRLYGQVWDLGRDLPAAAVLRLGRLAADEAVHDLDLGDPRIRGEVIALAGDLIPAPVLTEWLRRGLTDDQLGDIVMWVFGQHQYGTTGPTQGEATAPETGASGSSSNDGTSSSATSTASTASSSTSEGSSPG